ncbi:hypothetical protein [Streptomyces sp. NPDC008121]
MPPCPGLAVTGLLVLAAPGYLIEHALAVHGVRRPRLAVCGVWGRRAVA